MIGRVARIHVLRPRHLSVSLGPKTESFLQLTLHKTGEESSQTRDGSTNISDTSALYQLKVKGTYAEYINKLVKSPTVISFRETKVPPEHQFGTTLERKAYHIQVNRA